MKKIVIYGAGAIGSVIAARLALSGHQVSILARKRHVLAVRDNGLKLITKDDEAVVRIQAAEDIEGLGQTNNGPDLMIVTLKAYSLPAAASDLKLIAGNSPIVFVANGIPWWYFHSLDAQPQTRLKRLDPEAALWRMIDLRQVLGGVINMPAEIVEPGVVRCNNPGIMQIGEPGAGMTARLSEIASFLDNPGLQVKATSDIRQAIWTKLLANLPTTLLSTLTLSLPSDLLTDPEMVSLYERIVGEGLEVAKANGVIPDVDVKARIAASLTRRHAPSILQDMRAGKPMEVDAQLHAIRDMARSAGVPTLVMDIMLPLLDQRLAARSRTD